MNPDRNLWEILFIRKIKQLNSDLQAASICRTSLFSDGWAVLDASGRRVVEDEC